MLQTGIIHTVLLLNVTITFTEPVDKLILICFKLYKIDINLVPRVKKYIYENTAKYCKTKDRHFW